MYVDGKLVPKPFLIGICEDKDGGTLELFMSNLPNKNWGVGKGANPPSSEFGN